MRVRDEEATLAHSVSSLFALSFPIELVVILHLCTDRSAQIVADLRACSPSRVSWKVVEYPHAVSGAGLVANPISQIVSWGTPNSASGKCLLGLQAM
jgi:hypothetical protein